MLVLVGECFLEVRPCLCGRNVVPEHCRNNKSSYGESVVMCFCTKRIYGANRTLNWWPERSGSFYNTDTDLQLRPESVWRKSDTFKYTPINMDIKTSQKHFCNPLWIWARPDLWFVFCNRRRKTGTHVCNNCCSLVKKKTKQILSHSFSQAPHGLEASD